MVGSTPLRLIRVFLFLKTEIIFLNKKHPSGVLWVRKGNGIKDQGPRTWVFRVVYGGVLWCIKKYHQNQKGVGCARGSFVR